MCLKTAFQNILDKTNFYKNVSIFLFLTIFDTSKNQFIYILEKRLKKQSKYARNVCQVRLTENALDCRQLAIFITLTTVQELLFTVRFARHADSCLSQEKIVKHCEVPCKRCKLNGENKGRNYTTILQSGTSEMQCKANSNAL